MNKSPPFMAESTAIQSSATAPPLPLLLIVIQLISSSIFHLQFPISELPSNCSILCLKENDEHIGWIESVPTECDSPIEFQTY
ncbi:hypothetical protein HanRHA438_Chr03g0119541 [Helianthus annuus]|nr:hypothetical protein HanRHA438_Chr03g0119541 [Helianthus annuus]